MTTRTLLDLKFSSDPQIAPDGKSFVYVLTGLNEEENRYQSRVHKVYFETFEDFCFTAGSGVEGVAQDKNPLFSPDGKWLAFLSDRTGKFQLYVMPYTGGEPVRITNFRKGIGSYSWAPDSRTLVFSARDYHEGTKSDVRTVKTLRYWMNGTGFYGDDALHLWTVSRNGDNLTQITDGPFDEDQPVFSPDGRKVVFVSWRHENQIEIMPSIYSVDTTDRKVELIYEGLGYTFAPVFSPDGQSIAFFGHQQGETSAANNHVWVVSAKGGEAVDLTPQFEFGQGNHVGTDARYDSAPEQPVWSTDGSYIYFTATSGGNCNLYKVSLEGNISQVSPDEPAVINSFAARNETIVMAKETPICPAEMYAQEGSSSNAVTTHNDGLLSGLDLSHPERLSWQASDGLPLEGWLLKPPSFEEDQKHEKEQKHDEIQKYPMVLEIHGGPHTCYGNTFHHELQLLAASGYLVLYMNPRGSTGYGEDFVKGCIGDWGGKDYEDIMSGVDLVESRPYVDRTKMFVTGGSYGGYMTNWIVGHDNRFCAAVTQRSICNLYSMYGTSDIGYFFNYKELGGADLWEQEDFVMERSPIRYVPQVETPTKIIHSKEDLRCRMEQAEQWYIALKRRGVDTELVRFPDENHELSRSGKPAHRIERLDHIINWFDHYRFGTTVDKTVDKTEQQK
ncbi:S9 family peptidase [Alicyclobacillus sp. SO9]|nr:S9 family peptidase [Alicyclobacillus sp. SO9]